MTYIVYFYVYYVIFCMSQNNVKNVYVFITIMAVFALR